MKIPPQNIEMEKSILAGCLLYPDIVEEVRNILLPEYFYKIANAKIIEIIFENYKKQQPTDLIAITTSLKNKGQLRKIGGAVYLASILEVPIPVDVEYSCEQIKEAFILRKTVEILHENIKLCFANNPSSEIIDNTQKAILSLSDNITNKSFISMKKLTDESIERYEVLEKKGERKIKTGFHEFDTVCGGISGSKLITIAARPRVGKTAMMVCMALYMAKRGHKIGIFELEMDKEDLFDRIIAGETGIDTVKLNTGRLDKQAWLNITEAAGRNYDLPILIDDTGGLKTMELKRRIRKMKKSGCEVIFIDQLSKIVGDRRKSKFEEVTGIVEELGTLKKELRIPIILLAQINRKATENTAGRPTLENLKNSGQIEEESDIIILLNRPYLYTRKEEQERLVYFEVAKNRGGPERLITLDWDKKTTTFSNPIQEVEHENWN